jgi:hypothetical protein
MKIIAFVGPKFSGKDTSADLLESQGRSQGKIAFAGPLKELCANVFDVDLDLFYRPELKEALFREPIVLTTNKLLDVFDAACEYVPALADNDINLGGLVGRTVTTPRDLLQVVGTDFIRNELLADFHVRAAFSDAFTAGMDKNGTYCVTDARFPNELEFLRAKFGADFRAFYVYRPSSEEAVTEKSHQSERAILELKKSIPDIIPNTGTLADVAEVVKGLVL